MNIISFLAIGFVSYNLQKKLVYVLCNVCLCNDSYSPDEMGLNVHFSASFSSCLFFYENDGIRSHYFLRSSIALSSQLAGPKSEPQH